MKTIIRQHILPLAAMLLCIISALSCDSTDKPADTLTVSIAPQKHLVTAIAGDRFRIAVLVPKGMNPENYDPAPKTLLQLSESKAYIRMGSLPFEKTLGEKLSETGSDIPTFDVSEGIETIKTEGPHGHDADPHIWMSMKNAETIAVNTLGILCQILQNIPGTIEFTACAEPVAAIPLPEKGRFIGDASLFEKKSHVF